MKRLLCLIAYVCASCSDDEGPRFNPPMGPRCGDHIVDLGEECDGTATDGAPCTSDCELAPGICGNAEKNAGEQCDHEGPSEACDADCTLAMCGDGTFNEAANEQCDSGGDTEGCDADCTQPICGDGHHNAMANEACDDGNMVDTDDCTNACRLPTCGVGALACNVFVMATTAAMDSTDTLDTYACLAGDKSGPERVYEWVAPATQTVSADLEAGGGGVLDLIVLEATATCGAGTCIGGGPGGAQFNAVAGTKYLIVVDTDAGATAPFQVRVGCP